MITKNTLSPSFVKFVGNILGIFPTIILAGIISTISIFIFPEAAANDKKPDYTGLKSRTIIPTEKGKPIFKDSHEVHVLTRNMEFIVPKEISSGWTSFVYKNESGETHFFVLEKMPEGKTLDDSKKEVIPVFQEGMDLLNAGETEKGFAAFNNLPKWFFNVGFSGGAGLTGPHETSKTAVKLAPGTYLMECYVKMPNGQFHSANGMIEQIQVSDNGKNLGEAPKKASDITISSTKGIEFVDDFVPGNQFFAVHFKDQKAHEHFLGHDVHLARLGINANLEELNAWMNWSDPNAFKTPTPKDVIFLGGVQEMPMGETGYFQVDLKPGKYALIAEVPDPLEKNMLKTFEVR